jgi:hypothetical protein
VFLLRLRSREPARQFLIESGHEFLDLLLHGRHLFPHVEDDFHARQVHAELAGELEDHFQPFEILLRVQARVTLAAGRLQ